MSSEAAIDISYEKTGDELVFAPTGHRYLIEPGRYRRHQVTLIDPDERILQIDTIDLRSDVARERFIKSIAEQLGDALGTTRRELRMIAANLGVILPDETRIGASYDESNPYTVDFSGVSIERYVPNMPAPITTQLANFGAEIKADIQINDGQEDRREFELDAWQGATRRTVTVPAKHFGQLGWAVDSLGASAVVYPGPSAVQHVAAAIQLHSKPERKLVFGHTGWRQLDDGAMGFLTASGAMTGDGLRSAVTVQLAPPLDLYRLPDPPMGDERVTALQTLLDLFDLAPASVTVPMFCALVRSIIGPADFVLFLKGSTGQGKTQIAGMVQACFGKALGPDSLPANFSSTGNAIEMTANLAKDCILVVDDFQRNAAVNMDAIAERIGRAVGNHAGRARLTREAQLRQQRPPRGTVIMTGEDIPKGESLRARMSIVEMPRGGMRFERLGAAQDAASSGVYAQAFAAYVSWFAADYEGHKAAFHRRFEAMRQTLHEAGGPHPKTMNTAAHLMAAFSLFSDFLRSLEAWTPADLDTFSELVERELRALIQAQGTHLQAADPVLQFLSGLESAITSGRGHLTNRNGEPPRVDPQSWGYLKVVTNDGYDWRPRGQQIGWLPGDDEDDEGVYLDFGAAFQLVQQGAVSIGNANPLTETTLLKRLDERGFVLSRDVTRGTLKSRRHLQGRYRNVAHLRFPLEDEA